MIKGTVLVHPVEGRLIFFMLTSLLKRGVGRIPTGRKPVKPGAAGTFGPEVLLFIYLLTGDFLSPQFLILGSFKTGTHH